MGISIVTKRLILIILVLPLVALAAWCGWRIHGLASQRAAIKKDYSVVNSIEYGLLSVNVWRDDVQEIISDRVDNLNLTPEQEKVMRAEISSVLNSMISKVDSMVQHGNNTLKGKLTRMAVNTFVDWKSIRAKVPGFSQTILSDIEKPRNKKKLQDLLLEKVNEFAAQTYDSTIDSTYFRRLLIKYSATTVNGFNKESQKQIDALQYDTYGFSFVMLGVMVVFLLLWLALYRIEVIRKPLFALSALLALTVLLTGISAPMIEIDARINKLDFVLLGEHLQFNNQVLFYQSKSILDVVWILLNTSKPDSIFVGVLILIFSIVFPISKLLSTEIYLFGNERVRKNKLLYFFAFRSGKWSMADVMVVAIFMAYIGFRGILDNQLQGLDMHTRSLRSIATNLTSLQPGFILFVAFVMFGLILSEILKRISAGTLKVPLIKNIRKREPN